MYKLMIKDILSSLFSIKPAKDLTVVSYVLCFLSRLTKL